MRGWAAPGRPDRFRLSSKVGRRFRAKPGPAPPLSPNVAGARQEHPSPTRAPAAARSSGVVVDPGAAREQACRECVGAVANRRESQETRFGGKVTAGTWRSSPSEPRGPPRGRSCLVTRVIHANRNRKNEEERRAGADVLHHNNALLGTSVDQLRYKDVFARDRKQPKTRALALLLHHAGLSCRRTSQLVSLLAEPVSHAPISTWARRAGQLFRDQSVQRHERLVVDETTLHIEKPRSEWPKDCDKDAGDHLAELFLWAAVDPDTEQLVHVAVSQVAAVWKRWALSRQCWPVVIRGRSCTWMGRGVSLDVEPARGALGGDERGRAEHRGNVVWLVEAADRPIPETLAGERVHSRGSRLSGTVCISIQSGSLNPLNLTARKEQPLPR